MFSRLMLPELPTAPSRSIPRRRQPLDLGALVLSAFYPGFDLLSGLHAGRELGKAIRLAAAGDHQPDRGLGPDQRRDRAGADAVRAKTRQPPRDHRPVDRHRARHRRVGYVALWLADLAFKVDFRFWIVALKLLSGKQALIALIYLVPFTPFFVIALHVMHRNFSTRRQPGRRSTSPTSWRWPLASSVAGLQYGALLLNGSCSTRCPIPLRPAVHHRRDPVRAADGDLAVIATFTWRRTGSSLPGALICSLLVTWYVVAGTATQAAF